MDIDIAQKLLDEKVAISYEAPFEDLMAWVECIYQAAGIRKSISERMAVRLHYEKLHKQSIKDALKRGKLVPGDVLRDLNTGGNYERPSWL